MDRLDMFRQEDHSERNEQVQRMGAIYSQAYYVLSCLGDDSPGVDVLRSISQDMRVFPTGPTS